MKLLLLIFATVLVRSLSMGQIIETKSNKQGGQVIWYPTLSINKGSLGMPVYNYQAKVQKDVNGNRYLQVCNSDDWMKGTVTNPSYLTLCENPQSAVTVVLDYKNQLFKFYPYNEQGFSGAPHHTNTVLNFVGNDKKLHSITFFEFADMGN